MKQPTKQLHRFLLVLLCVLLLCQTVLAVSCSLRVTLTESDGTPVPDIGIELCQVAAFDGERFSLTQEFEALGLSAEELAANPTVELAEQVNQYVLSAEIEGTILATNGRGWVDFTALEEGVYLVFERGNQYVSFQPYLITLPTEQDGQLYYNIHSTPKAVSPDSRSILVMKLWEDDDNAAGRRPNHIKVTLCRNGIAIRTVVLNEKCNWQHTFQMLPGDGEYTIEELPVRNYESVCEEVAEGFLLTNTYTPSSDPEYPPVKPDRPEPPDEPDLPIGPDDTQLPEEPQEPSLPQTGFRMWPVYALLIVGCALVIWGLAEVCLRREEP